MIADVDSKVWQISSREVVLGHIPAPNNRDSKTNFLLARWNYNHALLGLHKHMHAFSTVADRPFLLLPEDLALLPCPHRGKKSNSIAWLVRVARRPLPTNIDIASNNLSRFFLITRQQ